MVVNCHDDVATDIDAPHTGCRDTITAMNAGGGCRTAFRGLFHKQALFHGQIQRFTEPIINRQCFNTEKSTMDAAIGDEIVGNVSCRVDGNGEADSGRGAGGRVNR